MTLAEIAYLLDVDPKWVLNAATALGRPRRYSIALARRLAVTLALNKATGAPLVRAFGQAGQVLRSYRGGVAAVVIPTDDSDVGLSVDIHRILSSLSIRLSMLHTTYAPRQRGRPSSRRRDPLQAASDWGTDLSLLADNLGKTVEQRVRQLDSMAAFARGVGRLSPSAR